ncbi:MAG TPA: hypothetical protein VFV50_19140 [Bdellovibrionales bacterium]|nr:hypothetical protein [Bdellovibrionales bacterium]
MVATFPSISDPNWARLLGVPVEVSYTKEHFDWDKTHADGARGHIIGGLIDQVQSPPQYEYFFDFKPEGFVAHLASIAWSVTTSVYWLNQLEKEFFASDKSRDFKAFILNTDMIAHTKGEQNIMEFLNLLEERIKRIRERHLKERGQPLEVILISDHGNAFLSPKPILPAKSLERMGWDVRETLKEKTDVAFVFPEILSFAAMYCLEESRPKLASDMARVEGVQSAFYLAAPNTVEFHSLGGVTRAAIDPGARTVRYEIIRGQDPFSQYPLFAKKRVLRFEEYFEATLDTAYPNAFVRAWEAFHINSEQKASVLVNPVLGYVFANRTLHLLTKFFGLKAVHGSLHRTETLGIVVSTSREFGPLQPDGFLKRVKF